MAISWVTSSGESGIAEDSYEFAMQHQAIETQTIGDVVPRKEASPQERINESFSEIPRKRFYDQNYPLAWGLNEINQNIQSDMQDPGPKIRQQNEQQELDSGIARTPLERQAQATPSGEPFNWDVVPGPKLLKEKGIDKILDESGNILITPHHLNEPGVKEYLANPPADVEVKKHGDMYYIRRKGSSFEGVSREPTRDEEVDIRQAKLGEMLHDLRVRIIGDPEKWATKEHIGDFVDKAMSVMGGGIRRPPKGGLGRGLTSSIGEERIQSAAMKVGDKVYEGENHGIAYEKAGDHHPSAVVEEGFTTNKGRFVSREEAADIAKKQEQVLLEARQTENLHSGELKYGFERVPKPPVETSQAQWEKYMELSSQGKTTKQIIKATKMDPEVVRDALGRDNLALAAFNSENALTEAYFNQLKTMPPDLEKALRAKGVSVKDLKTFTRSLPEEDLAHIFQQLPENVKTWWQAGELRRQKIDEGKKGTQIPKGSSEGEPLGPKPPRGTVKAGWENKTIHEKEVESFLAKNELEPLTNETRISSIESRLNQMLRDRVEFRKQNGKDAYYPPTGAIEVLKNRIKELSK